MYILTVGKPASVGVPQVLDCLLQVNVPDGLRGPAAGKKREQELMGHLVLEPLGEVSS